MRTAEVVEAVAAETGFGPEAATGLRSRVHANLVHLTKVRELVVKTGEREVGVARGDSYKLGFVRNEGPRVT